MEKIKVTGLLGLIFGVLDFGYLTHMTDYVLKYRGDPVLRQVATKVPFGTDVRVLVDAMIKIMTDNNGMGISGNQVGALQRIIVIIVDGKHIVCINPSIRKCGGKIRAPEGCLSYPGKEFVKTRSKKVILSGFNQEWVEMRISLSGIEAVCAQHEIDHLNGITIGD